MNYSVSLPGCLWPARLCTYCKWCSACPTFDFDASGGRSTLCRLCCPGPWLKSSAIPHWEASWQRSGKGNRVEFKRSNRQTFPVWEGGGAITALTISDRFNLLWRRRHPSGRGGSQSLTRWGCWKQSDLIKGCSPLLPKISSVPFSGSAVTGSLIGRLMFRNSSVKTTRGGCHRETSACFWTLKTARLWSRNARLG